MYGHVHFISECWEVPKNMATKIKIDELFNNKEWK
jgi:hypothetical protein